MVCEPAQKGAYYLFADYRSVPALSLTEAAMFLIKEAWVATSLALARGRRPQLWYGIGAYPSAAARSSIASTNRLRLLPES